MKKLSAAQTNVRVAAFAEAFRAALDKDGWGTIDPYLFDEIVSGSGMSDGCEVTEEGTGTGTRETRRVMKKLSAVQVDTLLTLDGAVIEYGFCDRKGSCDSFRTVSKGKGVGSSRQRGAPRPVRSLLRSSSAVVTPRALESCRRNGIVLGFVSRSAVSFLT